MSGKIKRHGFVVASAYDIFVGITGFATVPKEPQMNADRIIIITLSIYFGLSPTPEKMPC